MKSGRLLTGIFAFMRGRLGFDMTRLRTGAALAISRSTGPLDYPDWREATRRNTCCSSAHGLGFLITALLSACGGGDGTSVTGGTSAVPSTYYISATVTGLAGAGLEIALNSNASVAATGNGSIVLGDALSTGTAYMVTLAAQPYSPTQTCAVSNGVGSVGTTNVTSVSINCVTNTYTVGGLITGLTSGGLGVGDSTDNISPGTSSTAFTLPTSIPSGAAYAVTISSQPAGETCAVANGAGTVIATDVTDVTITCAVTEYSIGGTIDGLTASGLILAGTNGSIAVNASSTSFALPTQLAAGSAYSVSVSSQPTGQTCSVINGAGVVGASDVTGVVVACVANTYAVGGTITGLSSGGLVLADGIGTIAAASGATSFMFSSPRPSGAAYTVSVKSQPPSLTCTVSNGSGTIAYSNVTAVVVACGASKYPIGGTITGLSGAGLVLLDDGTDALSIASGSKTFTFATPLATGASYQVSISAQASGLVCAVANSSGTIVNTAVSNIAISCGGVAAWAFENGSMTEVTFGTNPTGVYGTRGVAAAGNVPGGRGGVTTWTDGSGNLWLFGGAEATNSQIFGDFWEYNIANGLWTWVGGTQSFGSAGVYGQLGSAAASNIPGARFGAVAWTDVSGAFWLFGGTGFDSTGTLALLNDLWKYTPTTNLWSWVSGSNTGNQSGIYGTIGTPANANVPGGRTDAVSWTDATGNLYLFGGNGLDSNATQNALNDLWIYSPGSGKWTWISGSNSGGVYGAYGTQGLPAAANAPGAREFATSWTDLTGNLWIFGGNGFAMSASGELSDLWKFTPGAGQWTWMAGSRDVNQLGVYGTLGTASANNSPGARSQAATWVDSAGKLRMFGGYGYSSSAPPVNISDFWLYDPTLNEWTWTGGASDYSEPGVCGTQGVASSANIPGARYAAGTWADGTGSLWLFGGTGADCLLNGSYDEGGQMNDLWRYGK
jgi:N-acetylneuraminic acid mutarotase